MTLINAILEVLRSPSFWAIIIPALAGVITFSFSKAAERESEWRKEKLRLYLNFIETLSGITDSERTIDGEMRFAKACNDLHALASSLVLKALHDYQRKMAISNKDSTQKERESALDLLILEMRKDLKIKPKDKIEEFKMVLWTSGGCVKN